MWFFQACKIMQIICNMQMLFSSFICFPFSNLYDLWNCCIKIYPLRNQSTAIGAAFSFHKSLESRLWDQHYWQIGATPRVPKLHFDLTCNHTQGFNFRFCLHSTPPTTATFGRPIGHLSTHTGILMTCLGCHTMTMREMGGILGEL